MRAFENSGGRRRENDPPPKRLLHGAIRFGLLFAPLLAMLLTGAACRKEEPRTRERGGAPHA
ncbi:MAG TPA: hypothetical protein VHM91_11425 [Verrucomicrobiales bacterium]|nr:hypothetical protein [Verrucomicrobiales bacterium]